MVKKYIDFMQHNIKMWRVLGWSIKKCGSFLKYAVLAFAFFFFCFWWSKPKAILLVTINQIYKQKKMDHKKVFWKQLVLKGKEIFLKKTKMLLILLLFASLGCLLVGLRDYNSKWGRAVDDFLKFLIEGGIFFRLNPHESRT